jgi:hypothetical protein
VGLGPDCDPFPGLDSPTVALAIHITIYKNSFFVSSQQVEVDESTFFLPAITQPKPAKLHQNRVWIKVHHVKSNSKITCKLTSKQILVKNSGFSYSNSSLILPQKNSVPHPQPHLPHILVCSIPPQSIPQRIRSSTASRRLYRLRHMSHLKELLE